MKALNMLFISLICNFSKIPKDYSETSSFWSYSIHGKLFHLEYKKIISGYIILFAGIRRLKTNNKKPYRGMYNLSDFLYFFGLTHTVNSFRSQWIWTVWEICTRNSWNILRIFSPKLFTILYGTSYILYRMHYNTVLRTCLFKLCFNVHTRKKKSTKTKLNRISK